MRKENHLQEESSEQQRIPNIEIVKERIEASLSRIPDQVTVLFSVKVSQIMLPYIKSDIEVLQQHWERVLQKKIYIIYVERVFLFCLIGTTLDTKNLKKPLNSLESLIVSLLS